MSVKKKAGLICWAACGPFGGIHFRPTKTLAEKVARDSAMMAGPGTTLAFRAGCPKLHLGEAIRVRITITPEVR